MFIRSIWYQIFTCALFVNKVVSNQLLECASLWNVLITLSANVITIRFHATISMSISSDQKCSYSGIAARHPSCNILLNFSCTSKYFGSLTLLTFSKGSTIWS